MSSEQNLNISIIYLLSTKKKRNQIRFLLLYIYSILYFIIASSILSLAPLNSSVIAMTYYIPLSLAMIDCTVTIYLSVYPRTSFIASLAVVY